MHLLHGQTMLLCLPFLILFFFNDTATTEIYTLSLHDALPISLRGCRCPRQLGAVGQVQCRDRADEARSEEHTSELQSHSDLVCRLLLEKKKKKKKTKKMTEQRIIERKIHSDDCSTSKTSRHHY